MFAMPGLRAFSLAAERASGAVSCGVTGVFVGDVPLLRAVAVGPTKQWLVRALPELNEELSAQYGLPNDVAAKAGALALIAAAFNRGDLAMAAIATVQMQFPDPPLLAKGRETEEENRRRALELHRSRLLKFWDPATHPRTGTPPNPGEFAPVADGTEAAPVIPVVDRRPFWPWGKKPAVPGSGTGPPTGSELPFSGAGIPRLAPPPAAAPAKPVAPQGAPAAARPAAPAGRSSEPELAPAPRSGGRLGNAVTRAQNAAIAADLKDRGYEITGGGGVKSEEYIPGPGPGGLGGTYVDVTAVNKETGTVTRVQTIDTLADGSPTPREAAAAARIRAKYPNDKLILIPKRRYP